MGGGYRGCSLLTYLFTCHCAWRPQTSRWLQRESRPIAQHNPKGNILIDGHRNARLCDFGISRELTEAGTTGLTTTSAHTGTERYLSYELLEETCVPTTASDVYALACTGLEVS